MHESVRDWVMRNTQGTPTGARVLEIGSWAVNGTIRELFDTDNYVGLDYREGPGVDLVGSSHDIADLFDPGSFDIVLCLEMLEHDSNPWDTAQQIAAVLSPGGVAIITARGNGFPLHFRPDRWRFMRDGMRDLVDDAGLIMERLEEDPQVSGWFVVARKPEVTDG